MLVARPFRLVPGEIAGHAEVKEQRRLVGPMPLSRSKRSDEPPTVLPRRGKHASG